jgi:MFS family permease
VIASSPPRLLRALRHRNYKLFFSGQTVSLVGTWITRIATSWLVYRLTGSELLLGVVGFCGQIPTLLLSPLTGVLVDRYNRHRILLWTQVASMLQSFALAALALTGVITVTHILILQLAQGVINSFDTPARQSFVVQLVADREDLPNAIALNSSMVNASRIIGPSIGGMLIAAFGEGWCFLLDGISYIAVLASLLAMTVSREKPPRKPTRAREELSEGFHYAWKSEPIRIALFLLAMVATLGMPYSVLMPAIASDVLHGDAHTLGFLMTASGVGALVGALYLASRRSVLGLGRVMTAATLVFGGSLMVFGLSRQLWLSLLILPMVGGGMMVELASTNTILQTIVEERLRGRVMSFYAMAVLGTAPVGSLLAGLLADRIGASRTIFIGGSFCVLASIWFSRRLPKLREQIRPIYVSRGIMAATEERAAV